jgi:hypothetical protein
VTGGRPVHRERADGEVPWWRAALAVGSRPVSVALLGVEPELCRPPLGLSFVDCPPVAEFFGLQVAAMDLAFNGVAADFSLRRYLGGGQHEIRVTGLRHREQVD